MESPQIFSIYLLSFGSVMTSLNEEARPARLSRGDDQNCPMIIVGNTC